MKGVQIKLMEKQKTDAHGPVSVDKLLGRFTLIIGDINTGKTTLTQKMLDLYCLQEGVRAVVVDLAPTIVASNSKGTTQGIGGMLKVFESPGVRLYHCRIHAPRLNARNEREARKLAAENVRRIESLFESALSEGAEGLFVNDCSLYLHAGSAEKFLGWIRSLPTAVVNGYYGSSLGSGPISDREREGMNHLINRCDRLIRLKNQSKRTLQG